MRELDRVMDLVFAGERVPVIDHAFPREAIEDAMPHLADQVQFGKIVLRA